jgi:integrase
MSWHSTINRYLDYLALRKLIGISNTKSADYVALSEKWKIVKTMIAARIPSTKGTSERMGLLDEQRDLLLEVVDPKSPKNPWKDERVKARNELYVKILDATGMRMGEVLGLKIEDVDLEANVITVHRTPDDPEDRRLRKPQTKTMARPLPIKQWLADLIRDYIIKYRARGLKGARKTAYLFVGTKMGQELSCSAAHDVFITIRETFPDCPRDLSAHLMRHTWNDRFSEQADEKIRTGEWTQEQEQKIRCELMGWVPDSKMAQRYSRRHIIRKAHEVSLQLQSLIAHREPDESDEEVDRDDR